MTNKFEFVSLFIHVCINTNAEHLFPILFLLHLMAYTFIYWAFYLKNAVAELLSVKCSDKFTVASHEAHSDLTLMRADKHHLLCLEQFRVTPGLYLCVRWELSTHEDDGNTATCINNLRFLIQVSETDFTVKGPLMTAGGVKLPGLSQHISNIQQFIPHSLFFFFPPITRKHLQINGVLWLSERFSSK